MTGEGRWGWAAETSEWGTGRNRRGWDGRVKNRNRVGNGGGVVVWDGGSGAPRWGIGRVVWGGGRILEMDLHGFFNVEGEGGEGVGLPGGEGGEVGKQRRNSFATAGSLGLLAVPRTSQGMGGLRVRSAPCSWRC